MKHIAEKQTGPFWRCSGIKQKLLSQVSYDICRRRVYLWVSPSLFHSLLLSILLFFFLSLYESPSFLLSGNLYSKLTVWHQRWGAQSLELSESGSSATSLIDLLWFVTLGILPNPPRHASSSVS